MKNKELFYKNVNILQKAYYNGTLEHANCTACAVGNLLCANLGIKTISSKSKTLFDDFNLIKDKFPNSWSKFKKTSPFHIYDLHKTSELIGYYPEEIIKIEESFENTYCQNDEDGYKGLCAVLDVLMEIHEFNTEDTLPEKEVVFNKKELVLVEA